MLFHWFTLYVLSLFSFKGVEDYSKANGLAGSTNETMKIINLPVSMGSVSSAGTGVPGGSTS